MLIILIHLLNEFNDLLARAREQLTNRAKLWFQLVILNELNELSLNDHGH